MQISLNLIHLLNLCLISNQIGTAIPLGQSKQLAVL